MKEKPIEDGMIHPVDKYLQQKLNENPTNLNKLTSWYWDNKNNDRYVSSVLLCIGRLEKDIIGKDGIEIMTNALKSTNVETREAAVSSLENWGGQDTIDILLRYISSENVKWLKNYANKVIIDLQQS